MIASCPEEVIDAEDESSGYAERSTRPSSIAEGSSRPSGVSTMAARRPAT